MSDPKLSHVAKELIAGQAPLQVLIDPALRPGQWYAVRGYTQQELDDQKRYQQQRLEFYGAIEKETPRAV